MSNFYELMFYLCCQDKQCRAGCEHEKAACGGLKDKTKVSAGDGEKLPWAGGGPGEEGIHST